MQGRPIRLAVAPAAVETAGAVELVLANDVVDELSDIDGGLIPDGFGIERTILGACMPLEAGGFDSGPPFVLESPFDGATPLDSLIFFPHKKTRLI